MILSMAVFGTVGIFVRYISLPSGVISGVRGLIGAAFLFAVMVISGKRPSISRMKGHGLVLILSGIMIGANWICLFEAYRYTTVATATLCYYLQPVFVTLASPFIFHEKLNPKKVLCVFAALCGIVLISWKDVGEGSVTGIALGIGAAVLYAAVVMMNKSIPDVEAYDRTFVQLLSAGIVMIPYTLLCESFENVTVTAVGLVLLLILSVFHTGVCYSLYFGAIPYLSLQTFAILGFIDPVVAIILSSVIFREDPGITGVIGAVLILGAAFISEVSFDRKKKNGV